VHPLYGSRDVKVGDFSDELNPDERGGTTLSVDFLETNDDTDATALSSASAASLAAESAADLDVMLPTLNPPPDNGTGGLSLSDFIAGITAIGSEINLLQMQIEGKINKVINTLQGIADTFDTVAGLPDSIGRLIASLRAIAAKALAEAQPTSWYIVANPTTLPCIAVRLKTDVSTLLKLNPSLARSPILTTGTPIQYYS
jgi:hypothetical protein